MKLRPIGKKADLSLSINAIVILILAITMLGLGLGFLRGTFKKTTAQFAEVAETVKEQIIDKIKSSNEKVAFDRLDISLKRSEDKELFYGIRNVLQTTTTTGTDIFYIKAFCDKALKTTGVGLLDVGFQTFSDWEVKQGEVEVLKLIVSAKPGATLDTYSCNLLVCTGAAPTVPTGGGFACGANQEYVIKKFFVTVSAT